MVRLEQVSRRYEVGGNEVYALRDVDLEVDQGEFAVVLGPSGSGKSTLLNMISALDSPTSGRAVVAGEEITGMARRELFRFRREVVSFVFQTFNLFPTLTALENVQCGGEIAGPAREARRRAEQVLATMPELGMDVVVSGGTIVSAVVLGVVAVAVAPLLTARRLRHMDIPGTLRVVE